jgi:hypothetical protein
LHPEAYYGQCLLLTEGVPGNGKPYPEESMIVKIECSRKKRPVPLYFVETPDT